MGPTGLGTPLHSRCFHSPSLEQGLTKTNYVPGRCREQMILNRMQPLTCKAQSLDREMSEILGTHTWERMAGTEEGGVVPRCFGKGMNKSARSGA